ncbi:MAG: hypothetical protein ACLGSD_17720 [Acidobacteriota bacterium]
MLRNMDSKTRNIMASANLCLVTALVLWLLVHPASHGFKDAIHFLCGLLLGVSIALNLHAIRRRKSAGQVNC